uniref:amidohydrolase family protein n=1 Tax=Methanocalculus natronophilus TaxID=1262400 RepID=UPI0031B5DAFA
VLNHDSIYAELIVDGVHLHHAAVNLAIKAKGTDKLILISDAMRAAGLSDGKYDLAGQEVTVENGEARLADGTIAGSTLNLNKAIKNVIKHNNVSIEDAVKMASTNPAKAIGIFDRKGSIAEGKTADLVFFDETITIKKVMKNGYLFDKF